jgi:hypothetical protein
MGPSVKEAFKTGLLFIPMALIALHTLECSLSIMACTAAFAIIHFRHVHLGSAFLHIEESIMALITDDGRVTCVIEIHRNRIFNNVG